MATKTTGIEIEKGAEITSTISPQIQQLQAYAATVQIKTYEDACEISNKVFHLSDLKKKLEDQRKEFTAPLNKSLKSINSFFKQFSEPLEEIDATLRKKVLEFGKTTDTIAFGVLHLKKKLGFKIIDENQVPREYMSVDMDKVKLAHKAGISVPGIEVVEDKITSL